MKREEIREIKLVSSEPFIIHIKNNKNIKQIEKEIIVKAILVMILMLACMLFDTELHAMTRKPPHKMPKDGQLIALVHRTQLRKSRPVYVLTHYNAYDHQEIIYESGRWYTCNMKDVRRLIKREHPFIFWCDNYRARKLSKEYKQFPVMLRSIAELNQ